MSRQEKDGLGVLRHMQGLRVAPRVPLRSRRMLAVPPGTQLPTAVANRIYDSVPIYDQGQVGRCTGMATKTITSAVVLRETGKYVEFSADFSYSMSRLEEGVPLDEDSGCAIPDVMRGLCNRGICKEEVWPTGDYTREPSDEAKQEALLHKGLLFFHCPNNFTIRAALAQGFGVSVGITVFENMMSPEAARTGVVLYPEPGERALGGHNVVIYGYDMNKVVGNDQGFWDIRNSWSDEWGDRGNFKLPMRYGVDDLMIDAETLRAVAA